MTILESELVGGTGELSGSTAFVLHDTYGFPLELTQEIAGERDVTVDVAGFETEMAEQRQRAKAARRKGGDDANLDAYREVVEQFGTTTFTGYTDDTSTAHVLASSPRPCRSGEPQRRARRRAKRARDASRVFLDRTPVLRRERRTGRRSRHDHHRDRHAPRSSTRRSPCPTCAATPPA